MNYINEYYRCIKDESIVVGQWVRIWYERIINGIETGLYFYDHRKANKAIKFIESFARHHEGALAPNLLKLELWQKAFLSVIFGIVDSKGNRQFREVFLVIGRKNGKTLLASAIAEYMAFLDGEYGARVYFTAPKLQQANLGYNAFFQMIQKEPELSNLVKKRRSDCYIESTNSSVEALAYNAKTSDGLNVSLAIADEVSNWRGDGGLKFYEVLKSSFGARRQPMLLSISTASYENESAFDELMRRATRVILGDSKETRLAPFLYMIDDINRWNDLDELKKSNPNLGISITEDYLIEEIAIAEGSLPKKAEFLTKYCNIKQNSSLAFLSAQTVQKCVGDELDLNEFRHSYCVAGLDLSQTTDLTAANVVIEKNGELYVFSKFWLPSERIEEAIERDGVPYNLFIQKGFIEPSGGNFIDYHDCFDWFRSLVEEYEILPLIVGYDRYSAQYLIQDMKAYGFNCDDVYQGDNLWGVIQEAEGLMKDGKIHIGNNDLMKMHLLDSAVKMNNERGKGKLIKINKNAHVDGMAALLDALCVRQKHYLEFGEQLKNEE